MPAESPDILVCFDGSAGAEDAIAAGAALFPGRRAEVVHAWAPTDVRMEDARLLMRDARDPTALGEALREAARARSEEIVRRGVKLARAAGWDAVGSSRSTDSGVWFEIARLAAERSAAVVVVGARGLGGARGAIGSVSDALVHYCACPVLVVHPGGEEAVLRGGPLVIGYDGSEPAARAVRAAAATLPGRRAVVVAVGGRDARALAEEGAERARAAGLDATAGSGSASRARGRSRAMAQGLVAAAEAEGAAALVVGSRGRSIAAGLLLGSVAMALLHAARMPVLVVPGRAPSAAA